MNNRYNHVLRHQDEKDRKLRFFRQKCPQFIAVL